MSFDIQIKDGDLAIGLNGDVQKIENTDKLKQDMLKMVLTPLGGNPFFTFYGSSVSRSLIGSSLNYTFFSNLASDQIKSSLETLMKLQKIQQKDGQRVSAAELLAAVQQVVVEQNQTDPRYFRVIIRAVAKDLNPVATQFEVGL